MTDIVGLVEQHNVWFGERGEGGEAGNDGDIISDDKDGCQCTNQFAKFAN